MTLTKLWSTFIVFYLTSGPLKRSFHSRFKLAHSCQKKGQFTQERVEYNVFLFDESLKVLTSCQIYQNPLTQEKLLKF
jgi:hypothetical protein